MKAKNNKTGEIVTNFAISKEFGTISYVDSSKTLRLAHACDEEWTMLEDENDDFSNSFDWKSFRNQAAYKATQILGSVMADENGTKTSTEAVANCPICGYEFKENIESWKIVVT